MRICDELALLAWGDLMIHSLFTIEIVFICFHPYMHANLDFEGLQLTDHAIQA